MKIVFQIPGVPSEVWDPSEKLQLAIILQRCRPSLVFLPRERPRPKHLGAILMALSRNRACADINHSVKGSLCVCGVLGPKSHADQGSWVETWSRYRTRWYSDIAPCLKAPQILGIHRDTTRGYEPEQPDLKYVGKPHRSPRLSSGPTVYIP